MSRPQPVVVNKRMSFWSSMVWGVCSIVIVAVVCVSGIVFYGMRMIEHSGGNVFDLIEQGAKDLPAAIEAVPALQDVVSNQRRLAYADALDVSIRFEDHPGGDNYIRPVVTVCNTGHELVSVMGLRVVVSDAKGRIVLTDNEYLATPVALGDDLPGPLAPGATRRVPLGWFQRVTEPSAEFEIPELRVWVEQHHGAAASQTQAGVASALGG